MKNVSIDSLVGFGGDGLTWHLESYGRLQREHPPSSDSFPKQNSIGGKGFGGETANEKGRKDKEIGGMMVVGGV